MERIRKDIYDSITLHERISVLRSMDHLVRMANHEDAYEVWILVMPDEAGEDEYMDIALDDEAYEYTCQTFVQIISAYGKYGW